VVRARADQTGVLFGRQIAVTASVQAKLIEVSSGEVLATADSQGRSVRPSLSIAAREALQEAADEASKAVLEKLASIEDL
jgi:hypothetical protein